MKRDKFTYLKINKKPWELKIEIETGEPVNNVNAGEPVGTTRRQQAKSANGS